MLDEGSGFVSSLLDLLLHHEISLTQQFIKSNEIHKKKKSNKSRTQKIKFLHTVSRGGQTESSPAALCIGLFISQLLENTNNMEELLEHIRTKQQLHNQ